MPSFCDRSGAFEHPAKYGSSPSSSRDRVTAARTAAKGCSSNSPPRLPAFLEVMHRCGREQFKRADVQWTWMLRSLFDSESTALSKLPVVRPAPAKLQSLAVIIGCDCASATSYSEADGTDLPSGLCGGSAAWVWAGPVSFRAADPEMVRSPVAVWAAQSRTTYHPAAPSRRASESHRRLYPEPPVWLHPGAVPIVRGTSALSS